MRPFLPLLVFAGLAVLLALGLSLDPSQVDSPLIGQKMPAFNAPALLDEQRQIQTKDWTGRSSLINVWASWCVACLDEHPLLMALYKSNAFPIYGINYKDKKDDAFRWLNTEGNPYRDIVYDIDGNVGIDWGVYGVPESYVVDAEGIIRYKHVGPLTDPVLTNKILPLLEAQEQQ